MDSEKEFFKEGWSPTKGVGKEGFYCPNTCTVLFFKEGWSPTKSVGKERFYCPNTWTVPQSLALGKMKTTLTDKLT